MHLVLATQKSDIGTEPLVLLCPGDMVADVCCRYISASGIRLVLQHACVVTVRIGLQVFSKLQTGRTPVLPEIIKGIADIQGIARS